MSHSLETSEWHRLSSRVIWVDLAQSLLALIPTVIALVLANNESDTTLWPLFAITAFGLFGAAADAIRWAFTRYRITDTHVERTTGMIFKEHRSIRRERIRSVDVEAKLRHRLAHLRVVKIGAGQQSATGEAALALDALTRNDARALQSTLLSRDVRPAAETPEEAPAESDPREILATFQPGWVIFNMFNIWAYVLALGVLWGGYWLLDSVGVDVDSFVLDFADWEALGWLSTALLAFLVVTVVGTVGLGLSFFAEFWNFELARLPGEHGTQLRTRKGLFTTREVNRNENRIRGVELGEPLFWRWLGVTDTSVITTGLDANSAADPTAILPRTDYAFARETAARALEVEPGLFNTPLEPHPRGALVRRLWWATLSALVIGAILIVLVLTTSLPAAVLWALAIYWPVALLGAVIAYRTLGHAIVGPYLLKRSGLLTRSTVVLRRDAVSTIAVRQSLLQRRLGLASVHAMTAAGNGIYTFDDIAEKDSTYLASQAAPGLLDEFLTG